MDLLAPVAPGANAYMVLQDSYWVEALCFPPDIVGLGAALMPRPAELAGANEWYYGPTLLPPSGSGSSSSSSSSSSTLAPAAAAATATPATAGGGDAAPIKLDAGVSLPPGCCATAFRYVDYGVHAADMRPGGTSAPTGYLIQFVRVTSLCQEVLTNACIAELSPMGCYTRRKAELADAAEAASAGGAASSTATTPIAIAASGEPQQARPGLPKPSPPAADSGLVLSSVGSTNSNSSGDSDVSTGAVIGAVIGGVAVAALLAGVLGVLVVRRRRRLQQQQHDGKSGRQQIGLSPAGGAVMNAPAGAAAVSAPAGPGGSCGTREPSASLLTASQLDTVDSTQGSVAAMPTASSAAHAAVAPAPAALPLRPDPAAQPWPGAAPAAAGNGSALGAQQQQGLATSQIEGTAAAGWQQEPERRGAAGMAAGSIVSPAPMAAGSSSTGLQHQRTKSSGGASRDGNDGTGAAADDTQGHQQKQQHRDSSRQQAEPAAYAARGAAVPPAAAHADGMGSAPATAQSGAVAVTLSSLVLGAGASGRVYAGMFGDRPVAVKVFLCEPEAFMSTPAANNAAEPGHAGVAKPARGGAMLMPPEEEAALRQQQAATAATAGSAACAAVMGAGVGIGQSSSSDCTANAAAAAATATARVEGAAGATTPAEARTAAAAATVAPTPTGASTPTAAAAAADGGTPADASSIPSVCPTIIASSFGLGSTLRMAADDSIDGVGPTPRRQLLMADSAQLAAQQPLLGEPAAAATAGSGPAAAAAAGGGGGATAAGAAVAAVATAQGAEPHSKEGDDAAAVADVATAAAAVAAGAGSAVAADATAVNAATAVAAAGGPAAAAGGVPGAPPEALMQLRNELEVLGHCKHPAVIELLAVCLTPPRYCLVMERMETSLEKLIFGSISSNSSQTAAAAAAGGTGTIDSSIIDGAGVDAVPPPPPPRPRPRPLLPLHTVVHIALQIAQALEYLHPLLAHRDLKPANVLLNGADTDYPQVKLSDFGLSRFVVNTLFTRRPEAGTAAYMAPECYDATNYVVTHRGDIYSFGVVLWTMLTGEQPWKDFSTVAIAVSTAMLYKRLPLEGLSSQRCPRKLRGLLEGCWDADPMRRPAAAEVVKQLLLVQEDLRLQQLLLQQEQEQQRFSQQAEPQNRRPVASSATGGCMGVEML
ncbi:hypothetical protein HXX76_001796 [Chlamydomonas incerta]|uniref:Protein kinase domain-containing protein n=1 Tax=Chlamydomonas incerta TaxID=51695 RepID=A0A835TE44_CHLIN|nr:hypothetical protein HXX76_001796 [Chlamydomonas incerta]|eukprot:KAG2443438.1 hypothetical protein HXX76_001796 [Chlamydomonas incerta]